MVSLRAGRNWGLKVLQPIDIRYGVDLRKRACRRWLLKMLDIWNPRLAIVESLHCLEHLAKQLQLLGGSFLARELVSIL